MDLEIALQVIDRPLVDEFGDDDVVNI